MPYLFPAISSVSDITNKFQVLYNLKLGQLGKIAKLKINIMIICFLLSKSKLKRSGPNKNKQTSCQKEGDLV